MSVVARGLFALTLVAAAPALAQPGALVVIGGGGRAPAVLDTFVALAGRGAARIVVVPWASAEPDSAGAILARELRAGGAGRVDVAPAPDHPLALTALRRATGIFLAGGDQARLMDSLRSTVFLAELRRRHAVGIVLGGTSAGAAVMSAVMITGDELDDHGGEPWSTIRARAVDTDAGLGLIDFAIVDQHFTARRRHNRLLSVVLERPALLGIGIDEATAIVVAPDRSFGVVGDGVVVVYDARSASEVATDPDGDFAAEGVTLHLLTAGRRFDPAR